MDVWISKALGILISSKELSHGMDVNLVEGRKRKIEMRDRESKKLKIST